MSKNLDWDDIKALLAVAQHGSLSAAGTALHISQPTLGRRIDRLEASLRLKLVDRGARGAVLTPSATDLLAHAADMEAAAARLHLKAHGSAEALTGTVRITAPMVISHFHMPVILSKLIAEEPGVEVELVASDSTQNLLLREADIAVRTYRPTQADLVMRKVADMELGLYAAHDYVARHGMPVAPDLAGHHLVGYDRNRAMEEWMRNHGFIIPDGLFRVRTDDQAAYWRMVVAGAGIGANQCSVGNREPGVVRVLPDLALPRLPVWLVSHGELKSNRLIRRTFDHLATALERLG